MTVKENLYVHRYVRAQVQGVLTDSQQGKDK